MYLSYTSRKLGEEQFKEAWDTLSTSPQDHHSITQLSSTMTSCVELKLLGTHPREGGKSNKQQDQIIVVIYSKTRCKLRDK